MSIVLREGTVVLHDEINSSPAALLLTSGDLAKSEYIRFLFMLWHIYEYVAIISGLVPHRCHDPL
jgi:heme oxygenase (biliverdin-producing, ferredoxin)